MNAYATRGAWGERVPDLPVKDPSIYDNPDPEDQPDPMCVCVRTSIAYFPQSKFLIKTDAELNAIQRVDFYEKEFPKIAYKLVDLDNNRAYSSDNGGHAIGGRVTAGTKSKGQNALFGDGHVAFGTPPKGKGPSYLNDNNVYTYRIRQENEETTDIVDGVVPRTNRYFFYLQP
jgi:prepilin-type processing-associated H-X9-DG protein